MVEDDTIKLLRECDAGVKMGLSSINEVVGDVESEMLSNILKKSREKHEKLDSDVTEILHEYHDEGREPTPMAKGMSWMKTNMKMAMEHSDATIADLMTDGCNMGIKSLRRYLNQYPAAEKRVKGIAEELICVEQDMVDEMKAYL